MLIQAAIDGQGFALGWTPYVNELLETGKLVRPIDTVVRPSDAYYLITPMGRDNPHAAAFSRWIREQAAAADPSLPVARAQSGRGVSGSRKRPLAQPNTSSRNLPSARGTVKNSPGADPTRGPHL